MSPSGSPKMTHPQFSDTKKRWKVTITYAKGGNSSSWCGSRQVYTEESLESTGMGPGQKVPNNTRRRTSLLPLKAWDKQVDYNVSLPESGYYTATSAGSQPNFPGCSAPHPQRPRYQSGIQFL
jgi:hypothetical protein